MWSALKKRDRYKKVGEAGHVIVLSVDGDPQGCEAVTTGVMDAGYAQPFADMTRATIQVIIDMTKSGKKLDDAKRLLLIPGFEYTPANIAANQSKVWGCVK